MRIKRLLSLLCVLMLCFSGALAEGSFTTAEGISGGTAFTADAHTSQEGFCLTLERDGTQYSLNARMQEDGRLLIGVKDGMAVLLPAMPEEEDISGIFQQLEESAVFESAQYSSLFTLGQSVVLGSHLIAGVLLPVLNAWPALDTDGQLRAALENAQALPDEEWAVLTRYQADQRQYPGNYLWRLNVYAPCLPAFYGELHTDEYGVEFTLAVKDGAVSDWDETIHALEDGTETDGFLLRGFMMVFDEPSAKNVYSELMIRAAGISWDVELDHYAQHDGSGSWNAYLMVYGPDKSALLDASLTGTVEESYALPEVEAGTVIDAAQSNEWIHLLGL